MLRGADLGPQYWSYAIKHTVYLRNYLPHTALQNMITSFKYNSRCPDLHYLCVFGSPVTIKNPGKRPNELDDDNSHTTSRIFLGFTATNRNVMYEDIITKWIKTARHTIFDEAHY